MEIGRIEHGTDPQGRTRQLRVRIIRSAVVLPAPFGPRKPVIVPAFNAKDRSVTAETSPKRLVNNSASTTTVIRVNDP
jgi:hypothetical protein